MFIAASELLPVVLSSPQVAPCIFISRTFIESTSPHFSHVHFISCVMPFPYHPFHTLLCKEKSSCRCRGRRVGRGRGRCRLIEVGSLLRWQRGSIRRSLKNVRWSAAMLSLSLLSSHAYFLHTD